MAQRKDTKGNVFVVVSVILVALVAGAIALSILQQQETASRTATEYACSLTYTRYSTEWQNCVNDR